MEDLMEELCRRNFDGVAVVRKIGEPGYVASGTWCGVVSRMVSGTGRTFQAALNDLARQVLPAPVLPRDCAGVAETELEAERREMARRGLYPI